MPEPKIRFSNPRTNQWGMYPASFAKDKSWMNATGLEPDDLVPVKSPSPAGETMPEQVEYQANNNIDAPKNKGGRPRKNQLTP